MSSTSCGGYRPRIRNAGQPTGNASVVHLYFPHTVLVPVGNVETVEVRSGGQVPRSLDLFDLDFPSEGVGVVVFVAANGVGRLTEDVDVVVHFRQTTDDVRWDFQTCQVMHLGRIND